MEFDAYDIETRIASGRASLARVSTGLIDYLGAVKGIVQSASESAQEYQEFVALDDSALSAELGEKLRESGAQFAHGSMAMANAFSQMMKTMSDAYDRVEGTIPRE